MKTWLADRSPWVLAASLGLNLFFVGLIGATVSFGLMRGPSGPPAVQLMMKQAGPEAAPLFEQALNDRQAEIRQARADYRRAKSELKTALTAETVDREALRAALEGRTAASSAVHAELNAVFLHVAPNLPLETRERLVRHSKRRNPRR